MSRSWSESTKWLVIISGLVALVWIVHRFSQIITPLAIAAILAYILNPPVRFLTTRTKLPRTLVVACIYLALIVILSLLIVAFVPNLIQQVTSIDVSFQNIVEEVSSFFEQPLSIFGFSIDLRAVYEEVSGTIQSIVSPLASQTVSFLFGLASGFAWLIFVLIVSFYLLKDLGKLGSSIYRLVPADYRGEVRRLGKEVNAVWSAFFRSQLVLCTVIGTVVGVIMQVVGVRNALILGIIAGLLEIIPTIGPTIAAVPAVLIAYFQGSTYLSLPNGWFALLIVGIYVVIQQLENNVLVPRIIGRSLNLHPLVIIIGAIAGASLAGVLGMFLAAPMLASLRIVGKYIYCKLLDVEPPGPSASLGTNSLPVQGDAEVPEPVQSAEGEVDMREEPVGK
jgi:predicted PurR-regulated permease PerM